MDEASEEVALQLAAQGVIGKRVDQMEAGFMMALDYMIQLAEKDQDDKVLLIDTFFCVIALDSFTINVPFTNGLILVMTCFFK